MTPEQLVEKMAKEVGTATPHYLAKALRIVLQAIQDGEVVEYGATCKYDVLKPDFQKWMEK